MDHNLLVSELQSLVAETRRRNPEVRDAGEKALELLKTPQPKDVLAANSETLVAPITLGCKTKNAKIVGISIAALQRLVALGGVPTTTLPEVLTTLNLVAGQAVEIQLKLLQTLLSILTYCKDIHNEPLGNALLLCFKLQDSRVSVVSSTAAATLRQAVMLIFDRVIADTSTPSLPLTLPADPAVEGGSSSEVLLTPIALDAYSILSDLCLLTTPHADKDGEKPRLLKLGSLQRTFGLELIESILSGYESVVKSHPELLYLLRHSLDPLLARLQSEKPSFPVSLRVCRIIFVLIRSYSDHLPHQVETYLGSLIRIASEEVDEKTAWMRVLVLEVLRGICGDPALLETIYVQYGQPNGPQIFSKLVFALSRLVNEKPALLGIGSQMHGLGVPNEANPSAGYLDMGIDMVTSAASVGVSTVSAMMGSGGGGLGPKSVMKQRLIEQHDKAEAPIVPDTYIYLLSLQSLIALAEGMYANATSAEPTEHIHAMAEAAWPALLAALSYCVGTDLSDSIFAEVLGALQDFTVACGALGLATPRDAFLNTLGKYAVPPPVVSAMQTYLDNPGRSNSVIGSDTLGFSAALGVGASGPPSLSERNLACLKSLVTVSQTLAGSLGPAWHDVLETLQNANYLLVKRPPQARRPTMPSPQIPQGSRSSGEFLQRPDLFHDLDSDAIQTAILALFDRSRELDDAAFTTFVTALCRLSSEMIGLDSIVVDLTEGNTPTSPTFPLSPPTDPGRRRTSGLNVSHNIRSSERSFGLSKLRTVATLNLPRMVASDPAVGWDVVTQHLLAVTRHITAASTIRLQASETLAELLLSSMRIGKETRVQHQVFDVLVRQVDVYPISSTITTDYDVRSSGYSTLNQILESSGHSLEVGWTTIFGMLNNVCRPPAGSSGVSGSGPGNSKQASDMSLSLSADPHRQTNKGDANLVRIAFPSLTLICTDFLSSLDDDSMRQCIACLGCFGRQKEDVNITLAAIGLLWTVSDAVQGDRKELWLYLLTELLELGRDSRLEVRSSAMQTLFRCIELYGSNLSPTLWEDVFWKVIFPLLERVPGDESQVLALTSVGTIFGAFLPGISELPSFSSIYQHLLDRFKRSFISEPRHCCTAALKALERVLIAIGTHRQLALEPLIEAAWLSIREMSAALSSTSTPSVTPAPTSSSASSDRTEAYTQENLIALVRDMGLLHAHVAWTDDSLSQFSAILRTVMAYSRSPEYRPDVDVMSPLQQAIAELVASSTHLGTELVLADMAEFASLAYAGEVNPSGKLTYVALSKFCMPKIVDVLERASAEAYENGTIENVIGAYTLPIKLKYDCPAPSKYGTDPPLWKTAMMTFSRALDMIMAALDVHKPSAERFDGIWAQVMEAFGGILLADNSSAGEASDEDELFIHPILERVKHAIVPRLSDTRVPSRVVEQYAAVLRKASTLHHHDVRAVGGTTAPAVAEAQEATRYWAFDLLISSAASVSGALPVPYSGLEEAGRGKDQGNEEEEGGVEDGRRRVARLTSGAVVERFEVALKQFVNDSKLRGQMPFSRVREEELLYVLRHLATIQFWPNSLGEIDNGSQTLTAAYTTSSRPHLFKFYTLLLDLTLSRGALPSMWIFPSEHARLFGLVASPLSGGGGGTGVVVNGQAEGMKGDIQEVDGVEEMDAGDGTDLIEVNARDIARRCLELVGVELGL